jgi:outer membrane protein assembly factor BamB
MHRSSVERPTAPATARGLRTRARIARSIMIWVLVAGCSMPSAEFASPSVSPAATGGPPPTMIDSPDTNGSASTSPYPAVVINAYKTKAAPWHVAIAGTTAWTASRAGIVTRIDLETGAVRDTDLGSPLTDIAADASAAWAGVTAGVYGDASVARVDDVTGEVRLTSVGAVPRGIAIDGGTVWVALTASQELVAVDGGTGMVTSRVNLDVAPFHIVGVAEGLWVSESRADGVALVASDGRVLRDVRVGSPTAFVAIDGATLVAVELNGENAWGIDAATGKIKWKTNLHAQLWPGATFVDGNAWLAGGTQLFAVDPVTGEVSRSIDLETKIGGLASTPDRLFVTLVEDAVLAEVAL